MKFISVKVKRGSKNIKTILLKIKQKTVDLLRLFTLIIILNILIINFFYILLLNLKLNGKKRNDHS